MRGFDRGLDSFRASFGPGRFVDHAEKEALSAVRQGFEKFQHTIGTKCALQVFGDRDFVGVVTDRDFYANAAPFTDSYFRADFCFYADVVPPPPTGNRLTRNGVEPLIRAETGTGPLVPRACVIFAGTESAKYSASVEILSSFDWNFRCFGFGGIA